MDMGGIASNAQLIYKNIDCKSSNLFQLTKFNWEIMDFGKVFFNPSTNDRKLESPSFVSPCGTVWKICVLIGNSVSDIKLGHSGNDIKIVIERESETTLWSQFQLDFPSLNGLHCYKLQTSDDEVAPQTSRQWREDYVYTYEPKKENFVIVELYARYIDVRDSGELDLIILSLEEESAPLHYFEEPNLTPRAINKLEDDLISLLASGDGSDIALIVGEKTFKVHRNILSSRCEVFKAMLASDMLEQATNLIRITDLDPEVVQEMLTYIYSGTIPNIAEADMAENLLNCAEKYQLKELKQICCSELVKRLNSDNAIDMLCKAHMYNVDSLKKACIFKISTSVKAFMTKDEWIQVEDQHELYKEVVRYLFNVPLRKN